MMRLILAAVMVVLCAVTVDAQPAVLTYCNSGGTVVPCASGGAGSNAAAGATGAAVPAQTGSTGINVSGTLRGWTGISIGSHYSGTVAIMDGSGNQITSFGGGTQYTHDAALTIGTSIGTIPIGRASAAVPTDVSADNDAVAPWYLRSGAVASQVTFGGVLASAGNGVSGTGVQRVTIASDSTGVVLPAAIGSTTAGQSGALAMGAVTTAAPTYTTAQSQPLSMTTAGLLRVAIEAGAGSGGTALADDADFTAGTTSFTPTGGFYQSAVTACTDGDTCAAGITAQRTMKTTLFTAAGVEATLASDVVEDAAETPGGSGPLVMSVRRDTPATSAGASGDNATFNTNATGALYVQPTAGTSGGADGLSWLSAGTTEDKHVVKATAGTLYSITVTNTNAAVRYLKCENDTSANTLPGTDTPEFRMAIPAAATGAGFTMALPTGYAFSNALTCWIVTGVADSDVAEVAANEIIVFYTYK